MIALGYIATLRSTTNKLENTIKITEVALANTKEALTLIEERHTLLGIENAASVNQLELLKAQLRKKDEEYATLVESSSDTEERLRDSIIDKNAWESRANKFEKKIEKLEVKLAKKEHKANV
jgi:predicted  nucleic acid-binding Zn-ribbon protein